MLRGLRRFFILLAVFVGAILVFSKLFNYEPKDMTEEMAGASLPIVYLQENGQPVNELHGYVQEMDVSSMRDTITPLDENGQLPVQIDTYGNTISGLAFEVRSLDTTRLVQTGEVGDLQSDGDTASACLSIENLLLEGVEYQLKLTVSFGDRECYYYTRIIKEPESHIAECLTFVQEFHEITMDKEREDELSAYMEPSYQTENTNLHITDITGSLDQACWGDLSVTQLTTPVASVTELNDEYNVITLDYMMSCTEEDGVTDYYNVEEYYRVKYGTEKMYLLSFERTVDEIFQPESEHEEQQYINLGIRSEEVEFASNSNGHILCFVQEGELWSLNLDENRLTQVFSFRTDGETDPRENYDEHGIRIVRAQESGSVDFIVYGYMNRGTHEGQVGISACHYDSVTNTVEELLFIPSNLSYQMMKEQMGQVMYISDDGMFYLTIGNQVHQINLDTMEDTVLIDNLVDGCYKGSENGRYLAWIDEELPEAHVMHLTDLEDASTYDIEVSAEKSIYPLGFSDTDCIYGVGLSVDAIETGDNTYSLACSEVTIMDSADASHTVLKSYDGNGYYVTGITIDAGSIYLERAKKIADSTYMAVESDTIRNRDMQEDPLVYVSTQYSEERQTEVTLVTSAALKAGKTRTLVPEWILAETERTIDIGEVERIYDYYVYAKGKLLLATNDRAAAIQSANENRGVVISVDQRYIWKRGKKASQSALQITGAEGNSTQAKAINAILSAVGVSADTDALLADGYSAYQVLAETIGEDQVYDLTGCDVEEVLYYVGKGIPVYALREDGQAVLVTGYDATYTWVYDFTNNASVARLTTAASEQFAAAGDVFYAVDLQ